MGDPVAKASWGIDVQRPRLLGSGSSSRIDLRLDRPLRPAASEIRAVHLVADEDVTLETSVLEREFPTIAVRRACLADAGEPVIDDFAWRGAFDLGRIDRHLERMRPLARVIVRGADAAGVALEVLARYQRLVARRNCASMTALFDAVLDVHRAAFDQKQQPAYEHAIDTWQWLLRLEPEIGLAAQVAALFHDVELLAGAEVDRLAHRSRRDTSSNGMPGDTRRAIDGVVARLRGVGLTESDAERVQELVRGGTSGSAESALIDDADALSFLSLMSSTYADYFGLAQTRRKVTFMHGRLGALARSKMSLLRLRPDVTRQLPSG